MEGRWGLTGRRAGEGGMQELRPGMRMSSAPEWMQMLHLRGVGAGEVMQRMVGGEEEGVGDGASMEE